VGPLAVSVSLHLVGMDGGTKSGRRFQAAIAGHLYKWR
jgi:hypothetical protein